ncbi:MAG: hypothetical protein AB2693_33370 [Candidatus Thiodiazotropha sp.]
MPKNHVDKPVKYRDCAAHSGQVADQFCLDHSIMVCSECVNRKHRCQCQTSAIQTLSKHINKTHIQEFKDDVISIAQSVLTTSETLKSNISAMECQRIGMIEKAEDIRDTNISIIRAICSATIKDINEICQKKTSGIDEKVKALADMKLSLNDILGDIEKAVQPNFGSNEFIRFQEFAERTRKLRNELKEILEKFGRIDLSFCVVPDLSEHLSDCKQFGYVEDTVFELTTVQPTVDIKFPRMTCDEETVAPRRKRRSLCSENEYFTYRLRR